MYQCSTLLVLSKHFVMYYILGFKLQSSSFGTISCGMLSVSSVALWAVCDNCAHFADAYIGVIFLPRLPYTKCKLRIFFTEISMLW